MPVLKRQLSSRHGGALGRDKDWWRLVYDTDAKRLYVEHEWSYFDEQRPGSPDGGTAEMELAAYLAEGGSSRGRLELDRLLRVLLAERLIPALQDPPPVDTRPPPIPKPTETPSWSLIKSLFKAR
jgi:hypothetical protein